MQPAPQPMTWRSLVETTPNSLVVTGSEGPPTKTNLALLLSILGVIAFVLAGPFGFLCSIPALVLAKRALSLREHAPHMAGVGKAKLAKALAWFGIVLQIWISIELLFQLFLFLVYD